MIIKVWRILAPLLALGVLNTAHAQTTTPDLGRLFSSATEREQLNQMRNKNIIQVYESKTIDKMAPVILEGVDKKPENRPKTIVVNGVVQQGSREAVVWVNGEIVDRHTGRDDLRIYPGTGSAVVVGLDKRRTVTLKPGQRLHTSNGKIDESYMVKAAPPQESSTP